MKTTKRLFIVLCCILATTMTIATQAATIASGTCGKNGDNLTWTLTDDGTLTFSGTGEMYDYSYSNIPWGNYKEKIKNVIISNNITTIGKYSFYGCSGLTSITIPNSVKSIGNNAFGWCTNLTSVTLPNSLTIIGLGAFRGCSGLASITIPNSVTTIDECAFQNCTGLTSITISNSVETISNDAFSFCIYEA